MKTLIAFLFLLQFSLIASAEEQIKIYERTNPVVLTQDFNTYAIKEEYIKTPISDCVEGFKEVSRLLYGDNPENRRFVSYSRLVCYIIKDETDNKSYNFDIEIVFEPQISEDIPAFEKFIAEHRDEQFYKKPMPIKQLDGFFSTLTITGSAIDEENQPVDIIQTEAPHYQNSFARLLLDRNYVGKMIQAPKNDLRSFLQQIFSNSTYRRWEQVLPELNMLKFHFHFYFLFKGETSGAANHFFYGERSCFANPC